MSSNINSYAFINNYLTQHYNEWNLVSEDNLLKEKILQEVSPIFSNSEIQNLSDTTLKTLVNRKLIELFSSDPTCKTASKISQFAKSNNLCISSVNTDNTFRPVNTEVVSAFKNSLNTSPHPHQITNHFINFIQSTFTINDKNTLFEIIHLVLSTPLGFSIIFYHIKELKLNLKDAGHREVLIKIIELLLQTPAGPAIITPDIETLRLNPKDPDHQEILIKIIDLIFHSSAGSSSIYTIFEKLRLNLKDADHQETLIKIICLLLNRPDYQLIVYNAIHQLNLSPSYPHHKNVLSKILNLILAIPNSALGIFKVVAYQDPFGLNPQHNPEDKKILLKIIDLALLQSGGPHIVCENIENFALFGQENKKIFIQFFKKASLQPNGILSVWKNIWKLAINPQEANEKETLIEIIDLLLAQPDGPSILCPTLEKLKLKPKNLHHKKILMEILQKILRHSNCVPAICSKIDQFGLNPNDPGDKLIIIQILEKALTEEKGAQTVCSHLGKFALNPNDSGDKLILIRIFEKALTEEYGAQAICSQIDNFGFNPNDPSDKKALIEMIYLALVQPEGALEVCSNIKKFGFNPNDSDDKKTLFEIIHFALSQPESVEAVCSNIKEFGFNPNDPADKKTLIEIIYLALALPEGVWEVCSNIKKFGFNSNDSDDKKTLLEMTHFALSQPEGVWAVCENIHRFKWNPDDQKTLIDIVSKAILQPEGVKALCGNLKLLRLDKKNSHHKNTLRTILHLVLSQPGGAKAIFKSIKFFVFDPSSDQDLIILTKLVKRAALDYASDRSSFSINKVLHPYFSQYGVLEGKFLKACAKDNCEKMQEVLEQMLPHKMNKELFSFVLDMDPGPGKLRSLELMGYLLLSLHILVLHGIDENNLYEDIHQLHRLGVFKDLFNIRQPRLRLNIAKDISELLSSPIKQNFFQLGQKVKDNKSSPFTLIPLIYCSFAEINAEDLQNDKAFNTIFNKSVLKNAEIQKLLLTTLYQIKHHPVLLEKDHKTFIRCLSKQSRKDLKSICHLTQTLLCFQKVEELTHHLLTEGSKNESLLIYLKRVFSAKFNTLLPNLTESEQLSASQQRTLEDFDEGAALIQYIEGSVGRLCDKDRNLLTSTVLDFVRSLFQGSFHEWRYDQKSNPHLKKLFHSNPGLETSWRQGLESDLKNGTAQDDRKTSLNFFRLIQTALTDDHFTKKQFPELVHYLNQPSPDLKKQLILALKKPETPENDKSRLRWTLKAIELMDPREEVTDDKKKNILENLRDSPLAQGQLQEDLKEWLGMFNETPRKIKQGAKCIEGDNPRVLFTCGTSVQGSCQSVYGIPKFNKALMGYVANGQNRIIFVKDSEDKMLARAIFRILIDQNDFPALFLERVYPANASETERKAILNMAIAKAKAMDLPLYTKEAGEGQKADPGTKLHSIGGIAPYDYGDASKGLCEESKFTIDSIIQKITPLTKNLNK